jgi:two-component system, cell cycle sensor histidine kinase and response regulator CckA
MQLAQQVKEKARVLVVDDEPQVLVALEDLLSGRFTVLKSESPEGALKLLQTDRDIAVVITDQRMPTMTGDELLAQLGDSADALRILLTGFTDLPAVARAVNEGRIFAYVTKPWNGDDLRVKVEQAAEHFRLAKEHAAERKVLRDLMDNAPDGIYFKDLDLRFLRANRSFAAIVDASAGDLAGKRLRDLTSQTDAAVTESQEFEILSEGNPILDILRDYRRDGERRWLSESKAPIRGPNGDVIGLIGIARDVTERVDTAEALRSSEERLKQAQKMEAISRLAGGIAHDFNNLLSVIDGYGQLVHQALAEGDNKRDDVGEILAASRRAGALTKQLLAFSRRQVVKPKVLDLNDIVANVEKMLRRVIGENIDLVTKLSPALGQVRADAGQVEQIVLNLTISARDAMPDGGRLIIETSNVELDEAYASKHVDANPGMHVMLAITDTGAGMDTAAQKHVFEPFFTTKDVGKGTGLGLSTVYGIVRQGGGHIGVYSEPGRGTSFKIYFARVDRPVEPAMPSRFKSDAPSRGGTILLVEDDDAVRQITARVLRARGYNVLEARHPNEARRVCVDRGFHIDLLLTDIVMPETSGLRLAEELSQLHPKMRVMFMSGYPAGAVVLGGSLDSRDAYLEKPFTPTALAEKVREVLQDFDPKS